MFLHEHCIEWSIHPLNLKQHLFRNWLHCHTIQQILGWYPYLKPTYKPYRRSQPGWCHEIGSIYIMENWWTFGITRILVAQIQWYMIHPYLPRPITEGIVHINTLDLLTIIINYYAAIVAFEGIDLKYQPMILCSGDNNRSCAHHGVYRPQWMLTSFIQTPGRWSQIHRHRIECQILSKKKIIVAAISRGPPPENMDRKFKYICRSNTNICSCLQVPLLVQKVRLHRFHLKPEFISRLADALLLRNTPSERHLDGRNSGPLERKVPLFKD